MIDIGVNLTHPSLLTNVEQNIFDWQEAGVSNIIAIASNIEESEQLSSLIQKLKGIHTTLGCHPHHADSWTYESKGQLLALFKTCAKAVAIGETGLDFNRNYSSQENQIRAFNEQINLAQEVNLPLYLHERDAEDTLISILNTHFDHEVNGVLHCFTADKNTLKRYLDLGLYIGVTGWVCDERRGQDLQEAIKYIPQDRILIETDAPYLLPRTLRPRPKKNHPKFLPHIAEQIALILNIQEKELIRMSRSNTERLFCLNE